MNSLAFASAVHRSLVNIERSGKAVAPPDALLQRVIKLELQVASLVEQLRGPEAPKSQATGTLAEIKKAVCRAYGISLTELVSARRPLAAVMPRQIAMYLMRQLTTQSMPMIGRSMGGRDHTTVLHSVRKIEALRKTDPRLDAEIEAFEAQLMPKAPEPQQQEPVG